jgi:tetratricopeptide (TPR) repeat protein
MTELPDESYINLDLANYSPEIDTFLEFKNRIVKKVEKFPEFSEKSPDFAVFFTKLAGLISVVSDDGEIPEGEIAPSDELVREYIEAVIAATQALQQFHELFIAVPDFLITIISQTTNLWVKLATEFILFNVRLPFIKDVEVQEKYYNVVPWLEKIFAASKDPDALASLTMDNLILLILIYKTYTTALQKNRFLDDVQDMFILFIDNMNIFEQLDWKNPLLDNYHRMLVQVGLMLKKEQEVLMVIEWREKYLESVKSHLVVDGQDANVILNIININFSIAKNYLQLGNVDAHQKILDDVGNWLDIMMQQYPFTKKAWKIKVKMIRSLGHNALKRGNYGLCYRQYLQALVLSYQHKLQREYDRAMMYVSKYNRFFVQEHVDGLQEDLESIPERLSRTHLLYILCKMFTDRKLFHQAIIIQRLLVQYMDDEFSEKQVQMAVSQPTPEKTEQFEKIQDLYSNNLDYLGNLLVKTHQIDAALDIFKKEAALFENDKPRKELKVLMKIAKEMTKNGRFKDSVEFGERAYYLAREHEISDQQEKLLEFLIQACKMADLPQKLADYKKLLYGES